MKDVNRKMDANGDICLLCFCMKALIYGQSLCMFNML